MDLTTLLDDLTTLLDEVFVISIIIKVEVHVGIISRSRRLRLITLTETLIILDIINLFEVFFNWKVLC